MKSCICLRKMAVDFPAILRLVLRLSTRARPSIALLLPGIWPIFATMETGEFPASCPFGTPGRAGRLTGLRAGFGQRQSLFYPEITPRKCEFRFTFYFPQIRPQPAQNQPDRPFSAHPPSRASKKYWRNVNQYSHFHSGQPKSLKRNTLPGGNSGLPARFPEIM